MGLIEDIWDRAQVCMYTVSVSHLFHVFPVIFPELFLQFMFLSLIFFSERQTQSIYTLKLHIHTFKTRYVYNRNEITILLTDLYLADLCMEGCSLSGEHGLSASDTSNK